MNETKQETRSELESRFNSYGTLVTVASLILIVVYASGNYDGWDALISLMGLVFSGYYLFSNAQFDWFSQFLASLIYACSAVLLTKSGFEIYAYYKVSKVAQKCEPLTCPSLAEGGISALLVTVIVVAIFITLAWGKPNA